MANQYSSLTRKNILIKMNRKRNPVASIAQLAREFGYTTSYSRYTGKEVVGSAAPGAFRNRVKALVGEKIYNDLRVDETVNLSYR